MHRDRQVLERLCLDTLCRPEAAWHR